MLVKCFFFALRLLSRKTTTVPKRSRGAHKKTSGASLLKASLNDSGCWSGGHGSVGKFVNISCGRKDDNVYAINYPKQQGVGSNFRAAIGSHLAAAGAAVTVTGIKPSSVSSLGPIRPASALGNKPRTIFSDSQCSHMRAVFNRTPYLGKKSRAELASKLNISEETISVSERQGSRLV